MAFARGMGRRARHRDGSFVLDPIGKARTFLENGPGESLTFYAEYALQQFDGESDDNIEDPRKSQA